MGHVLIIEDNWFTAEFLIEIAEEAGATSTATAATEDDAVAAARVQKPALILSDVRLLVGTGPHAVRAIRSEVGAIPVIFVTGTPEDCEPCEPPDVILCKPIQRQLVIETMRRLAPQ